MLFLFGFAKAGLMPFHGWLPAAMVAPTPVSSFLHGVAVVKAGVFAIFRVIFHILGPETLQAANLGVVITTIASVTLLIASLVALTQDSMKRRLAYSTIGQLSYMVLGAGMLSATGMLGGVLHLAMHAFGKITLFFCAGAIYVASKKKYISQMDGLGTAHADHLPGLLPRLDEHHRHAAAGRLHQQVEPCWSEPSRVTSCF